MESREQGRPIHVTFAPPPSGESIGLIGFFWEHIKLFGHIAQKINPAISVIGFFVAALVAHNQGLGLWSVAVGLAVAISTWFIGGAVIFWSIFAGLVAIVVAVVGYLFFRFFLHMAS